MWSLFEPAVASATVSAPGENKPVLVSPVKNNDGAAALPAASEMSDARNVPSNSYSEIHALLAPFRIFITPAEVSAQLM
jgi:hypothetical protein